MTASDSTSRRRNRRTRAVLRATLLALALAWGSTTVSWSAGAEFLGTSPCAVPSAGYPTLHSAIDDPFCEGADLASGDYQGPFRITRDFPITGPGDFSARLLGGLEVEGDSDVVVRLESVRVELGVDPALIFADDFETGTVAAWSSAAP